MSTLAIVIMVLVVVIGVPFTLWWWKIADRWASDEHKRFKPRDGGATAGHAPGVGGGSGPMKRSGGGPAPNPFARGAGERPVERVVITEFDSKDTPRG